MKIIYNYIEKSMKRALKNIEKSIRYRIIWQKVIKITGDLKDAV